jgi:hypothetical protein
MALFARKVHNYDLYASHAWYMPGVKGMFGFLGWFIVGALLGALVQAIMGLFMSPQDILDYGMIVIYPVQFLPAMIYAAHKSQRNALFITGYSLNNKHFGKAGGLAMAGVTVLLTYATMLVADVPNYWTAQLTMRSSIMSRFYELLMETMKQLTGGPFWSSFLTVAILAPIFEEWLCRGMVLRGLLKKMKPVWAIVISAVFFAVIHGNPWQAVNAFILGLVMGFVYYKTGSLLLTMLIHFVNNGTAVVLSNVESLKDYDYWIDMIGTGPYTAAVLVALVVLVLCLWAFAKIPQEHSWGNIDEVLPVDGVTFPVK